MISTMSSLSKTSATAAAAMFHADAAVQSSGGVDDAAVDEVAHDDGPEEMLAAPGIAAARPHAEAVCGKLPPLVHANAGGCDCSAYVSRCNCYLGVGRALSEQPC